jgi:hypothetical protein
VEKKFGVRLHYSVESLILVDAIVDKVRDTGATEQQALGLLAGLGCYAGEVFVRHARASWRASGELAGSRSSRFAIVLALDGPTACDPIGRVFERFAAGSGAGVAQLYEAATASRGEAARRPAL